MLWAFALLLLQATQGSTFLRNARARTARVSVGAREHAVTQGQAGAGQRSGEQMPDCVCDCCITQKAAAHTSLQCLPRASALTNTDSGCSTTCAVESDLFKSFETRTGEVDYSRFCQSQCRPVTTTLNELCVDSADADDASDSDTSPPGNADAEGSGSSAAAGPQQAMSQLNSTVTQVASDRTSASEDTTALLLARGEMMQAKSQAEMAGRAARVARQAYERELMSARTLARDASKATLDEIKSEGAKSAREAWNIRMKYVKGMQAKAAAAARAAALPYKKAMLRDTNIASVWAERAGQLATAAVQREDMATGFEADAERYRGVGDKTMETKSMLLAQQALDQASAFQAQADTATATADKIKEHLPWYNWAEQAIAKTILIKSMPYDVVPPPMPPLP